VAQAAKALGKAVEKTVESVKDKLAPTAVALGLISESEEAEAAYIPLKAFAEGSEAAQALFKKAQKRIAEGADTRPNGELYNEMGVYRSEDGDFKVDVAELRARDVERMQGVQEFAEDLEFYLKSDKKRTKKFTFPVTRYIPEDSPIFENFPELADAEVRIHPRSIDPESDYYSYGFYQHGSKNRPPKIVVTVPTQLNLVQEGDKERIASQVSQAFNTFIHEFQHHIQDVKKSANTGYNTKSSRVALSGFINDYNDAVSALEQLQPGDIGYDQFKNKVDSMHSLVEDSISKEARREEFRKEPYFEKIKTARRILDNYQSSGNKEGDDLFDSYRMGHRIYIRELGEAEARSSGLKALLPEGPDRKAVGVFYPKDDHRTILRPEDIKIEDRLENSHVLVRAVPSYEDYTRHGKLYFPESIMGQEAVDPEIVKQTKNKSGDGGKGTAAVVGGGTAAGLASPPSEAFVEDLGERTGLFEDGSPTPSLFDVEGVSDELGISNTFMLDLLIPRTKPYDLISNIPGVGETMMGADLAQGLGSPDAETPDEFTDMPRDVAGMNDGGLMSDEKDFDYKEFGIPAWKYMGMKALGVADDVVDAAGIAREYAKQQRLEDNDKTEDTLRHILLGGLVRGDEEEMGFRRQYATDYIDAREVEGEDRTPIDEESAIDQANNIYGLKLREMVKDRDQFIETAKKIADAISKGEEIPDLDGVTARLSKGRIEKRQGGGIETEAGLEMEEKNPNKPIPKKADINKDGEIEGWEKARHEAIQKTKEKTEMAMGGMMGMMADPFAPFQVTVDIDEESGNEVPAGSKEEEVRDDIPAMLSEGEYVVPADVVRYHGLKTFEGLRCEAKHALGLMAMHDRISYVDDDTKEPVDYDIEEKDLPKVEKAEVEVVEAADGTDVQPATDPTTFYQLQYKTDPVTGQVRIVYVDPMTGQEVKEEEYEQERASRFAPQTVLQREGLASQEEEVEEAVEEAEEEAQKPCPPGFVRSASTGACVPVDEGEGRDEEQPPGPGRYGMSEAGFELADGTMTRSTDAIYSRIDPEFSKYTQPMDLGPLGVLSPGLNAIANIANKVGKEVAEYNIAKTIRSGDYLGITPSTPEYGDWRNNMAEDLAASVAESEFEARDIVSGDRDLGGSSFASNAEAQAVAEHGAFSDEHFEAIEAGFDANTDQDGLGREGTDLGDAGDTSDNTGSESTGGSNPAGDVDSGPGSGFGYAKGGMPTRKVKPRIAMMNYSKGNK